MKLMTPATRRKLPDTKNEAEYDLAASYTMPAIGGPRMVAIPRNMINIPKAEVNLSIPRTSTRTMEVRVTREAIQRPKMRHKIMYSVKLLRKGKMKMQIPVRKNEILVTKRESTHEKSEMYPHPILPKVLEIPMTERSNAD